MIVLGYEYYYNRLQFMTDYNRKESMISINFEWCTAVVCEFYTTRVDAIF